MKHKTIITIIFGMILLIGIVAAGPLLSNVDETINIPINVIAGNTFQGDFSFDYLAVPDNEDNLPLIIQLDVISDDTDYPVGKDEFEISGYVDKCTWTILGLCILPKTVDFDCSEDAPLTIDHAIGSEIIDPIPDGTFYCYNEEANLRLNENDKVFLDITSHPALYPGTYELIATLYYLTDTYSPIINIINKNTFETNYYRELDNIEVEVEIDDINLESYWATIFSDENIDVPFSHEVDGTYYFTRNLPIDIQEGDYELRVYSKDTEGYVGEDSTTLQIDLTGPVIEAIQPDGSIYTTTIPIELSVTDAKAGVNEQSVYYRLREMDGSAICPEEGIGTWDCYNSGWVKINLDGETYKTEIDTSELGSGEYWLEAKAEDILGNEGILE